jgi:putative pectin methyltransferase
MAAIVKIVVLVLAAMTLIGSVTWAGMLYVGHRAATCIDVATVHRKYRRLQEQLVTDLLDIGELTGGGIHAKEAEVCPP